MASVHNELQAVKTQLNHKVHQKEEAEGQRQQLKHLVAEKQRELMVEKDNENTIMRHQCDLKERLKELNAEAMRMRHE